MSPADVPERLRPLLEQLAGEPVAAVVRGQVVRGVIVGPPEAAALLDYLRHLLEGGDDAAIMPNAWQADR